MAHTETQVSFIGSYICLSEGNNLYNNNSIYEKNNLPVIFGVISIYTNILRHFRVSQAATSLNRMAKINRRHVEFDEHTLEDVGCIMGLT